MAARLDARRAALTLARQHLLTARFDCYKIKEGSARVPRAESGVPPDSSIPSSVWRDAERDTPEACAPPNPALGFVCKTVPHITLRSIARNVALDAIFTRHQPVLDAKRAAWRTKLDEAAFAPLSGTVSLPFAAGHSTAAQVVPSTVGWRTTVE